MTYSYYDYLESYYDYYYEYSYWPQYYNGNNMTYEGTYPPSPWEQPYPLDVFNPIFWGITLLCAVLSVAIFTFALYQIYQRYKAGKFKSSKTTIVLTIICLLLHVVFALIVPVSYYLWFINFPAGNPEKVQKVNMAWDAVWCLAKVSMYFVFMNRYYNIFMAAQRMNAEGKRKRAILFGAFLCVVVVQMALIATYEIFYYLFSSDEWVFDSKRIYVSVCWTFLAIDVLLVIVISYLLNRSILKLIVFQRAVATMTEMVQAQSSSEVDPSQMSGKLEASASPSSGLDDKDTRQPPHEDATEQNAEYDERKGKFKLVHTTTRIALLCVISLTSSMVYQVVWNIILEWEKYYLYWFTYTWSVDAVINMVCIYLSMGIAVPHYKSMCVKLCHCHQCCFACVMKFVSVSTQKRVRELTVKNNATVTLQTADV